MKEYEFDSSDIEAVEKGDLSEEMANKAGACGKYIADFCLNVEEELGWNEKQTEALALAISIIIGTIEGEEE